MRHQNNKLIQLNTGVKERRIFIRQLLTSLVRNGKVVTTPKRAKVLKSEADAFFSKLLGMQEKRDCIRYVKSLIYGEDDGKKVINVLLPKYKEAAAVAGQAGKTSSFVADYKVGFRTGDASPKVMVKLI